MKIGTLVKAVVGVTSSLAATISAASVPAPATVPIIVNGHHMRVSMIDDRYLATEITITAKGHQFPDGALVNDTLSVTVTSKTSVPRPDGRKLSLSAANFIFRFDLSSLNDFVTLPDLPLKIYPESEMKHAVFSTFIPESVDENVLSPILADAVLDRLDDDDEMHREPLLLQKHMRDLQASAELLVQTLPDGMHHVTVRTSLNVDQLGDISLIIPSKSSADTPQKHMSGTVDKIDIGKNDSDESDDNSLGDVLYEYYRGHGKSYKKYCEGVEEFREYLSAMLVGFISPFVLLGIAFVLAAVGVFAWAHGTLRREEGQVALPVDEKDPSLFV